MAPNPEEPTPALKLRDTIVTVYSTAPVETAVAQAPPPKKAVAIGPIVGGLVGGIAAGLALILFVIWYRRHRRKSQEAARRAYIRRRQRQMSQYAKTRSRSTSQYSRSQYSGSSGFSIYSGTYLKTPSPTEKSFDGSVAFPPPQKSYYLKAKEHDPFMTNVGYGYEGSHGQGYDRMLLNGSEYLDPAGGEVNHYYQPNDIQPSYNQVYNSLIAQQQQQQQHRRSTSSGNTLMTQTGAPVTRPQPHRAKSSRRKPVPPRSPPTSPPQGRRSYSPPAPTPPSPPPLAADDKRTSRSAARAAASDQAAANALAPLSQRHRSFRPSPLAAASARVETPMMFDAPVIGPSPESSPPSSDSAFIAADPYAAAATGGWTLGQGLGLGIRPGPRPPPRHVPGTRVAQVGTEAMGRVEDRAEPRPSVDGAPGLDFSRGSYYDPADEVFVQQTIGGGLSPAEQRVISVQYASDPFAEYHTYIRSIEAGLSADDVEGPQEVVLPGREPRNPGWI